MHGLSSYDEYKRVISNINLVCSGFDEVTRKYIGREPLIRMQIARVKADKKMSAEDKGQRLLKLNSDFQFVLPDVKYKSNIDLVAKYYDRLAPRSE
jgi:hypothetical protein